MITTDVHFVKGNSHDICEDYGYASPDQYIMIADGCSSGYHSDIASRLIIHSCKKCLHNYNFILDKFTLRDCIVCDLKAGALIYQLEDLLSTLIVAYASNDVIKAYFYGDGYLHAKYKSGEETIIKCDYKTNAPEYIWYSLDTNKYKIDDCELRIINFVNETVTTLDRKYIFEYTFNIYSLQQLSILTDGIDSFSANRPKEDSIFGNKITNLDAIKHLTDYKSTNGSFAKRRLNRFIKQTLADGFIHDDDVTIATMIFSEL